jgi:hypothetical protein
MNASKQDKVVIVAENKARFRAFLVAFLSPGQYQFSVMLFFKHKRVYTKLVFAQKCRL